MVVIAISIFFIVWLVNGAGQSNNSIETQTNLTNPPATLLERCLSEAENNYREEYKNRISGYNFLNHDDVERYRKKAKDGGLSSGEISRYIRLKQAQQTKIDKELYERQGEEKGMCIKLYK